MKNWSGLVITLSRDCVKSISFCLEAIHYSLKFFGIFLISMNALLTLNEYLSLSDHVGNIMSKIIQV
jgi:hypothetical protein